AIEYSPALTDIEVVVEQHDLTACVVILDRGPGFVGEREHSNDVESTKTTTSHVGLGLAIVEKVATSHGGQFTISAREGGGSRCDLCFTVC
ncbi:sensor histidine kinase, partial [Litorivicinus sp.]|nr:sensor histidine kinase [Litorivicinus sp.]